MKITFNGVLIAQEFSDGGFDTVQGFGLDSGKQNVQVAEGMDWADAVPIARFNRKRTIIGSVIPQPAPTLDAAMVARATLYDSLPACGALVTVQGAKATTWVGAVLESFRRITIVEPKGVTYGFELTFLPSGPGVVSNAGAVLGTGSGGAVLGDGAGGELGLGI